MILNNIKNNIFHASQFLLVISFFLIPLSVALANLTLAIIIISGVLSLLFKKNRDLFVENAKNNFSLSAIFLFVLIVFGVFWSPADGETSWNFVRKYIKYLFIPLFLMLMSDDSIRRRCLQAFSAAMLITLVSTWLNVWFDLPWSKTKNQGFFVDHTVFKDYISQGIMMSFFSCLALFQAFSSTNRGRSMFWWLIAFFAIFSILFLSSGRTGYLALIGALLVFVVVRNAKNKINALLSGVALVVVTAGVYMVSPHMQNRVNQAWSEAANPTTVTPTSIGARVQMWKFAMSQMKEHPVLGAGTGAYPVLAAQHFPDKSWCEMVCPHPHNQFLFFALELGLVGLAAFIWFFAVLVRQAINLAPNERALVLAFVTVMAISCMTHSSFWLSTESHFYIWMSSLLMASAIKSQSSA